MAICTDAFTIEIIAALDCHLAFVDYTDEVRGVSAASTDTVNYEQGTDNREFELSPGNSAELIFAFEYYVGIGGHEPNSSFSATIMNGVLHAGNQANMSIGAPIINPTKPDFSGGPSTLKTGTLSYACNANASVTYGTQNTEARSETIGGTLTMDTGTP